jgi:hypothetical protein
MNNWNGKERRIRNNSAIRKLVLKAKDKYFNFFKDEYQYSDEEAIEELGLDRELIHQLIEDYVAQVIKSSIVFDTLLKEYEEKKKQSKDIDLTEFQELAHKNLGVARNLRIKDAQVVLYDMMKKDDLEYLQKCLIALEASAIILKPECAFNTMKLIEAKSML